MKAQYPLAVDAKIENYLVEAKIGLRATRSLRDAIMRLAYILAEQPTNVGLLVLVDPVVTRKRIDEEFRRAQETFLPSILGRLRLVVKQGEEYAGLPGEFGQDLKRQLDQVITTETACLTSIPRDKHSRYVILQILVLRWLENCGPVTTIWLSKTTGYSYPTVARALSHLKKSVLRYSDRRVELRDFPYEEWARLIAVSEDTRSTMRFRDTSGSPRSQEALIRRMTTLQIPELAIGGVRGAKHYYPELDLVGSPRLDLSYYCHSSSVDLSFVQKLDPALQRADDSADSAALVVHLARRAEVLPLEQSSGLKYADLVECLMDLHEARLEAQAEEFLRALIELRKKDRKG